MNRESLGVVTPIDGSDDDVTSLPLFTRWFPDLTGKVFGRPAWLGTRFSETVRESLQCRTCKDKVPLTFLLQINTSKSNDGFHRTLYVFLCLSCRKDFRVIRGYLSRENPYYFPGALNKTKWASDSVSMAAEKAYKFNVDGPVDDIMTLVTEDLTEAARQFMMNDDALSKQDICQACYIPTLKSCDMVPYTDDDTELSKTQLKKDWPIHKRCLKKYETIGSLPPRYRKDNVFTLGPEMEIISLKREDFHLPKIEMIDKNLEEDMLDEKNQAMTAEQADEVAAALEADEIEEEIDERFMNEMRMLTTEGEVPIIRYDPGSDNIVWMTSYGRLVKDISDNNGQDAACWRSYRDPEKEESNSNPIEIPVCENCGANRRFECQLYSGLSYYASHELEFGTISVFVCENDCIRESEDSNGYIEGYSIEVAYTQFDDTTVKNKIEPLLS